MRDFSQTTTVYEEVEILFLKYSKLVDPVIKQILSKGIDRETREIIHYQIDTGGKRLRPSLAILSCLACGGRIQDTLNSAAGLEILHNYTLIMDDIIDHSEKRRNQPTTWKKFGRSFAECAAMDYSAAIFEAAARSKNSSVISKIFSSTLKRVVEGEIRDILFEQAGRKDERYAISNRYKSISFEDYFSMVTNKTASLFQASCEIGAIEAGANKKTRIAFQNYGKFLGIAFQIIDDILDIYGGRNFGKPIGKDISEHKLGNYVILRALKNLNPQGKRISLEILKKDGIAAVDIEQIMELINKTNAKEEGLILAKNYIRKAKYNLASLPKTKWITLLDKTADFITIRNR